MAPLVHSTPPTQAPGAHRAPTVCNDAQWIVGQHCKHCVHTRASIGVRALFKPIQTFTVHRLHRRTHCQRCLCICARAPHTHSMYMTRTVDFSGPGRTASQTCVRRASSLQQPVRSTTNVLGRIHTHRYATIRADKQAYKKNIYRAQFTE